MYHDILWRSLDLHLLIWQMSLSKTTFYQGIHLICICNLCYCIYQITEIFRRDTITESTKHAFKPASLNRLSQTGKSKFLMVLQCPVIPLWLFIALCGILCMPSSASLSVTRSLSERCNTSPRLRRIATQAAAEGAMRLGRVFSRPSHSAALRGRIGGVRTKRCMCLFEERTKADISKMKAGWNLN